MGRCGHGDIMVTGRLGMGQQVSGVANIVGIAAGQNHTVAVKNDATVMAWGYNGYGQLGDGTTTQRNTAISLSGVTNAGGIAAGNHTLILNTDGSIWSTGLNTNGQLGKGTATNTSTPATVVNFTFAGQVTMPTFSPEGGAYLQGQSVTVNCATSGAVIHYTTSGSDPTTADPVVTSGSTLSITNTTFLRAKAFLSGY